MTCGKSRYGLRPLALAVLALASQAAPALAADWRFTPELTVRETYSNNITLAPAGSERSAFVTEVAPGFSITGEGRRSRLRATYQARGVMYSNNAGSDDILNYLNADGTTELIDDLLFLDGQASIGQTSSSAFGPRVVDSSFATGNRSEVRTYSISPYARKRYGNFAEGELRYLNRATGSDNDAYANYSSNKINLKVVSGEAFRTLGWGVAASRDHSRYSDLDSVTSDYLDGTLRYRLTDQFSLTGSGGYERYTYATPGDAPEGPSWSVGFDWQPSPRTSVAATAGRRFYGDAYSFNGSHRSRYTTWNLSYNEDITTTQEQFADSGSVSTSSFLNQAFLANIPDPVARAQAVDAFIRATGLPATLANGAAGLSNRYFLQKRLQASVALTSGKSTAVLTAFGYQRQPQSDPSANNSFGGSNQVSSDDSRQRGVSGLYSLRLSPVTSVNLNGQYYRTTSQSTDLTDVNKLLTLGLSHQLSPKVSGTVELRRYQGSLNQTGSDFRESAISAYLSMRL